VNALADYRGLIAAKKVAAPARGMAHVPALHPALFDHQRHSTEFALRTGCAALFLDTGLGKSFCALEWGRAIVEATNKPVLMLAPLAVSPQHQREAERFAIDAKAIRDPGAMRGARVYVTNYERLDRFDVGDFAGVILDESSIVKSFTGATSRKLRSAFARTPFRLACTATPAPNDHMELGQHSDFLGVMPPSEMLSRWFIADQQNMGRYRVKAAARRAFWEWVASWARAIGKPSDLGFSDDGFVLPELVVEHHEVSADRTLNAGAEKDGQGLLFRVPDTSATSIHREKRLTAAARADVVAATVAAEPREPWIVWVDTDYEADAVMARLPGDFLEVRGSMPADEKEAKLDGFSTGRVRGIVTKASIAGFGLNWQHCARQCFAGLSFSYESYYQAIRRCWRFGQKREVRAHVVCADTERSIWAAIARKAGDHEAMKREMVAAMRRAALTSGILDDYRPDQEAHLPAWLA
jgi:superfamily II DNA or RNA helicase